MVQRVIPTAIEYSSLMVFVIVLFAVLQGFYDENDDDDMTMIW